MPEAKTRVKVNFQTKGRVGKREFLRVQGEYEKIIDNLEEGFLGEVPSDPFNQVDSLKSEIANLTEGNSILEEELRKKEKELEGAEMIYRKDQDTIKDLKSENESICKSMNEKDEKLFKLQNRGFWSRVFNADS